MNKKRCLPSLLLCFMVLQFLAGYHSSYGQDSGNNNSDIDVSAAQNEPPRVYLDCRRCDYNYVRREITFVNYVRDQNLANIHVFVTDQQTGGGGREYEFSFMGRGIFRGTEYTIKHQIDRDATSQERRDALNQFLSKGLAAFVLQTPLGNRFTLEYDENQEDQSVSDVIDDPWNYWVFEIYAGRFQLDLESNQKEFDSRWGFYADQVTDDWKFRIRPYFNYSIEEIERSDESGTIINKRRRHGLDSYAIKSLSEHWSAGLFGTYYTDNQRNYKHEFNLNSGIEYSLFPYSESSRKSITLTYQLGYGYAEYYEETIFGQTEEKLFNQQLRGGVSVSQPWGNINAGIIGSHYLHDFTRRRVEFYGRISARIVEGFSLSIQANYDVIQDQLSLPAGEASLEEVLLRQRELATDFSFYSSIAISYTFGSNYSNIVNTRF